jgi:hypothetical protein
MRLPPPLVWVAFVTCIAAQASAADRSLSALRDAASPDNATATATATGNATSAAAADTNTTAGSGSGNPTVTADDDPDDDPGAGVSGTVSGVVVFLTLVFLIALTRRKCKRQAQTAVRYEPVDVSDDDLRGTGEEY